MGDAAQIIETICATLSDGAQAALSLESVREWLTHEAAEVRGAAYKILREKPDRLTPHPTLDEFVSLALRYLGTTIGATTGGDWAYSGYEAARDSAAWFGWLAGDESTEREFLDSIVARLGDVCVRLDDESRKTMVNGALEHIFERREFRSLFEGWKVHPVLGQLYADACLWADRGGDSPLVGREPRGRERRRSE